VIRKSNDSVSSGPLVEEAAMSKSSKSKGRRKAVGERQLWRQLRLPDPVRDALYDTVIRLETTRGERGGSIRLEPQLLRSIAP
jgi:hypothetical protein